MNLILPQKPRHGFHSISELTNCVEHIIDYLAKQKVLLDEGSKSSGDAEEEGGFEISDKGKELEIGGGFAYCNGTMTAVPGVKLPKREGYVCVITSHDNETGVWSTPYIGFGTPGQFSYPIARVKKVNDTYRLTVGGAAVFIATEVCPVEKEWVEQQKG